MKNKIGKKIIFISDYIDCSNLDGNGPTVCVYLSDTGILIDEKTNTIILDKSDEIIKMVPNCMFVECQNQ